MANIDAKAIRELRERTQAGMTDCKNALVEAGGDMDKAVEIILKKGLAKSAKRAAAAATEGVVRAHVAADGRSAVMVEVNVQTDFSARNELFTSYVDKVMAAAQKTPPGADLAAQTVDGKSLADLAVEAGAKLGEKVAIRRWERVEVPAGKHGLCHAYVHMGGKIGVLVRMDAASADAAQHGETKKFADDVAMHVAAMNPAAVRREQIDVAEVARQREIFEAQLKQDPKPKPEAMWPKILDGKVEKWFSEVVLLEQESVVVPGQKVSALLAGAAKAAGAAVELGSVTRFERGEGVEKKQGDLANDVAGMMAK